MLIGELAAELRVNPRTIRYYERIGLLPAPERTNSNYRVYGSADRDRLAFIKSAQQLGLSLDDVREILAFRERGEAPCEHVRGVLSREVRAVDDRIDELRALRRELVQLDALADQLPPATSGYCPLIAEHARRGAATPAGAAHELTPSGASRARP